MKATETAESMDRMTGDNVAAMRRLADLNTDLWQKLAAKQLELMRMSFETVSKQLQVGTDVTRADELVAKQMEVVRDYGQTAIRINREIFDVLAGSRDAYQAWLDDLMKQTNEQVSKVAEVTKAPHKAA